MSFLDLPVLERLIERKRDEVRLALKELAGTELKLQKSYDNIRYLKDEAKVVVMSEYESHRYEIATLANRCVAIQEKIAEMERKIAGLEEELQDRKREEEPKPEPIAKILNFNEYKKNLTSDSD